MYDSVSEDQHRYLEMVREIASALGLGREAPLHEIIPAMHAVLFKQPYPWQSDEPR